jgi:uncharacterized protein (TIGR02466 family)
MKLAQVFSIPLFMKEFENIQKINNELLIFANSLEKKEKKLNIKYSNIGGFHSKPIEHNNIVINNFIKFIFPTLHEFLKEFNFENKLEIAFKKPWITINKKNNANQTHTHAGADFSCVYYIKAPKNCGNLIFYNNPYINYGCKYFKYKINNYNEINSLSWNVEPKEGTLIMFPSYLEHSVEENKSNEKRISMAFDINIKEII